MMVKLLSVTMILLTGSFAEADEPRIGYGRELVERNCSPCHAVTLSDESNHPDAPPFRVLSRLYPIEDLEEAVGEGISTGHPDMPEFVASPDQVSAIIAYIKSINGRGATQ